jgi:hypothetical protein
MVFMRYDPTPAFLTQPDSEAQAVVGVFVQFRWRSAAQQCVREADLDARGDLERDDLERGALFLPFEEGRPRLTTCVEAPHALARWRHIEITMSSE